VRVHARVEIMKGKSKQSNVKDLDPPEEERRNYLKTVGALVAGLAVGGAAGWLSKPAERVEVPGATVTAPGVTVTAPGATVTVPGPTVTVTPTPAPGLAELRRELAQKYANAKPGEKFLVGYVTWTLAQEAPKYDYQASDQAAKQLGLDFRGIEIGTEALKAVEATDRWCKGNLLLGSGHRSYGGDR